MVRRLAPTEVVVIHTGQIIVDQAVCMNHFNGSGKGSSLLPISAAHVAEFKNKTGAKPLSSGHKAVFYGFKQGLLRLGMKFSVNPPKIILYIGFVLRPAAVTVHPGTPPLWDFRQEIP